MKNIIIKCSQNNKFLIAIFIALCIKSIQLKFNYHHAAPIEAYILFGLFIFFCIVRIFNKK